jgi:DNA-binding CsgD family transcriptional regulator
VNNLISHETLSELIGSIYDCALNPSHWTATMDSIRSELDLQCGALGVQTFPASKVLIYTTSGMAPHFSEALPRYSPEVTESWGGADNIYDFRMDEIQIQSEVNSDNSWKTGAYYREWAEPQGIHDLAGMMLIRDSRTLGTLAFGRHWDCGPFTMREKNALRMLLPHVQRSVVISNLLDIKSVRSESFAATLDAMETAVLLVAENLHIVHANAAAHILLKEGDEISDRGGTLKVKDSAEAHALAASVTCAASDEASIGRRGFGIPVHQPDGSPAVLHVLPLRVGSMRAGLMPKAVAAVFISAPAASLDAPREALAALFDLTGAEVKVFFLAAKGLQREAIAGQLNLSLATVKTHLLRIFAKTGVTRLAELVNLSASLSKPV